MDTATARAMIRQGAAPTALNHNCSGKHSGMLVTAVHKAEPTEGYWRPDHPVQMRIARALEDLTGCHLSPDVCGIDGCSVPNWAMPPTGLAQAFARLATGQGLGTERAATCRRIREACWAHPDLVAGPDRLVTLMMERLPGKVLLKSGAEGVYCGALPERGLGFAIKIDDGAQRAVEAVIVRLLARFHPEIASLGPPARLTNWRGVEVGRMRATSLLDTTLGRLS
jgi:L-asparaginase II